MKTARRALLLLLAGLSVIALACTINVGPVTIHLDFDAAAFTVDAASFLPHATDAGAGEIDAGVE